MILLPKSVKIFVGTAPVDLHRSFEGLSNEVRCVLAEDPLSGHVFLFLNRRRSQVKMLLWTRGGFLIVHKRLERGKFTFPSRVTSEAARVEIDAHELAMLLEGLDATTKRSGVRWDPPLRAIEVARVLPTPACSSYSLLALCRAPRDDGRRWGRSRSSMIRRPNLKSAAGR